MKGKCVESMFSKGGFVDFEVKFAVKIFSGARLMRVEEFGSVYQSKIDLLADQRIYSSIPLIGEFRLEALIIRFSPGDVYVVRFTLKSTS